MQFESQIVGVHLLCLRRYILQEDWLLVKSFMPWVFLLCQVESSLSTLFAEINFRIMHKYLFEAGRSADFYERNTIRRIIETHRGSNLSLLNKFYLLSEYLLFESAYKKKPHPILEMSCNKVRASNGF